MTDEAIAMAQRVGATAPPLTAWQADRLWLRYASGPGAADLPGRSR